MPGIFHGDAVITVEGFAEPAGSNAFDKRLGLRRAEAVRDDRVKTARSARMPPAKPAATTAVSPW